MYKCTIMIVHYLLIVGIIFARYISLNRLMQPIIIIESGKPLQMQSQAIIKVLYHLK